MKQQLVSDWMTSNPIVVTGDTSLIDTHMFLKENDIRRLPVVDENDTLVGIITLGDVREASPSDASLLSIWEMNYLLSKLKIRDVMTDRPVTVYSSDTIACAAGIMLEHKVSGLPVIDPEGMLVGIITESDIFRLVVQSWDD